MFSLFKKPSVVDPVLGELRRSGGVWRGTVSVMGNSSALLVLLGTASAPDQRAIALVRRIDEDLPHWRTDLARELFAHLEPYAENDDQQAFADIKAPEDVWPHVRLVHVAVFQDRNELTLEMGYQADWDEEHTLGAFFSNGKLSHLNGSVGTP